MSRKISIAALCTGLLCVGLCIGACLSCDGEPEAAFWDLVCCGTMLLGLGLRGLLGDFNR